IQPVQDAVGTVEITVTISDETSSVSRGFELTLDPINDAPRIDPIADVTLDEDSSTGDLPFTVHDEDVDRLVITASSMNDALPPGGSLTLGGAGAARTIRIEPPPNQNGTGVVTLTVSDGELENDVTFRVVVTPRPEEGEEGGCGCRAPGAGARPGSAWLLLAG